MATIIDTVLTTMRISGRKPTICIACGRPVKPGDSVMRLRGGTAVHRSCATYDVRRRRTGGERLGYPRR